MYHTTVELHCAMKATQLICRFSSAERSHEPRKEICSSDAVFIGVFTQLSNILAYPSMEPVGFTNTHCIVRMCKNLQLFCFH